MNNQNPPSHLPSGWGGNLYKEITNECMISECLWKGDYI